LRWLDAWENLLAGTMIWSIHSARYNPTTENPYLQYYKLRKLEGATFAPDSVKEEDFMIEKHEEPETVSSFSTGGGSYPCHSIYLFLFLKIFVIF
jgi:hypothetical protein